MKCPWCQHENPSHAKFCLECGAPVSESASAAKPYADLKQENERLNRFLTEALEQQTATSEILRVMSGSPTDAQPIFDAIVESAVRLCEARYGAVFSVDGELVHLVAHHNFTEIEPLEALRKPYPMRPNRAHISGRAILSGSVVQIPDIARDPEYGSPLAIQAGFRSLLAVPVLRDGAPIGAIVIYRLEPGLFPERHMSLLQTFADQAVIAIENVRLFTELQEKNRALTQANAQVTEALDQQTATSEILGVISRSQTDVQPVFDTIAQSAVRLCGAVFGAVFRLEGRTIHMVALTGVPPNGARVIRQMFPISLAAVGDSTVARAIVERRVVHVLDTEAPQAPRMAREGGRPGRHRRRERAPVQGTGGAQSRPDRDARTADGDRRGPKGYQPLDF